MAVQYQLEKGFAIGIHTVKGTNPLHIPIPGPSDIAPQQQKGLQPHKLSIRGPITPAQAVIGTSWD